MFSLLVWFDYSKNKKSADDWDDQEPGDPTLEGTSLFNQERED